MGNSLNKIKRDKIPWMKTMWLFRNSHLFGREHWKLEVELSTRCVSKCPAWPRTPTPQNLKEDQDWNVGFLDPEVLYSLLRNDAKIRHLNFCGAYGDPIYHPRLHEIIARIHRDFPHVDFAIETNGSHRSEDWWRDLGKVLEPRDTVIFSIDGLRDTNHLYRVNTNWDSIMTGVKTLRAFHTGAMDWKWILFRHNQHQGEEAYRLSKNLGFNRFILVKSGRYDDSNFPTIKVEDLEANLRSLQSVESRVSAS